MAIIGKLTIQNIIRFEHTHCNTSVSSCSFDVSRIVSGLFND